MVVQMNTSRRQLLGMAAGACLAYADSPAKIKVRGLRIGVTDWNLNLAGKVEALALAKKLGFAGVEVSLGRVPIDGKLPLDNAELQAQYLAAVKDTKVAISGVCLDVWHVNPLKTDPLARKWLAEAIPIAGKLKAPTMLLPVFRNNVPEGPAELDQFADALKEFMPAAEKAKVILCLEDSVTAPNNMRMFDRVGSSYLRSWYDVGNVLALNVDPVKEIRFLGKDHIGSFHLKDKGYLGDSGNLDFRAILEAMRDIGYTGWADLETNSPSKDLEADMRKNLAYMRSLMA
jgi:sugar phosphate isomerase/epimerase